MLRGYVAQQGIRLIEIDSCPIDFRFHMHKNGKNQWVVVGIGAKKAGKGSVTTHLKNGGSLLTPEQALSRALARVPTRCCGTPRPSRSRWPKRSNPISSI
ncbi:hypothetical protein HMSSN139_22440 [Paenibacillus sp. HMSSN-139]|nr:hypothetical protein HMSSN139_22440 [Paenibacillus sp. HMSSN-139]